MIFTTLQIICQWFDGKQTIVSIQQEQQEDQ